MHEMVGLPVQLTVPSDSRFQPIVLSMARRVAESAGFSGAAAAAFGQELAEGASAAMRQSANGASIDVRFEVVPGALRVHARCGDVTFEIARALPGA